MAVRPILQLGHPLLYQHCAVVEQSELAEARLVVEDLHDTMFQFRKVHGVGRAIAAPQIGVLKRIVYMNISDTPVTFINPVLHNLSDEMFTLWDDCMSFPDLLIRLRRHRTCDISYRDLDWKERSMSLVGDLSELLQHECDHLDGILAVSRAVDGQSFAFRSELDPTSVS